ncbi:MAG: c-type cytochrome [Cyclobacteriaceae bacterium]
MRNVLKLILAIFCLALIFSCEQKKANEKDAGMDRKEKIKLAQYMNEGRVLYERHCANCHQSDGYGLARLYPPLRNSDYLKADIPRAVCIIRYGLSGEIKVNEQVFNMKMEGIAELKDLEIAEITTYIMNKFADSVVLVSVGDVRDYLKNCEE